MRIAVNTVSTKKGAGGAFQIAYNFLIESLKHQEDVEWYYITSADIDEAIGKEFYKLRGDRYFVFPTQPDFKKTYYRVKKELAKWEEKYQPDVIYTISSPCYFSFKTTEVMRFANAWVTNPNKESWKSQKPLIRIYNYFFFIYQRWFLKRCKFFITQSNIVGNELAKISKQPANHIKVIPNVLPAVFKNAIIDKQLSPDWVDVACIGNPYPHKNISIVPKVLLSLKEKGFSNIRFHLTIPDGNPLINEIMDSCIKFGVVNCIINHGRCSQVQLIEVYNHCSICFLPTLLETFSATSLEAMHFGLDIVASDYAFNREVIGNAGLYYSSLEPVDAANKIILIINNEDVRVKMREERAKRMAIYGDYEDHFRQIFTFLRNVASHYIG